MHALIVVSHPLQHSLTHGSAAAIAEGITAANPTHTVDIADLTQEGFNPTFSAADMAAFQQTGAVPPDVLAEQARIDRADALVLVFPVYWWSMPGLLKGWIDRVFTNGWAYDDTSGDTVVKKLAHLPVHLVALGAVNRQTFVKRGYADAFNTQVGHGIFDYCGAPVLTSEVLLMPEMGSPEACLERAQAIGRAIFR
ncbi:NAD(P)H-dependent oxidoreductase [Serratia rhizosphaerae]|uniref:NAD(P)H-dependent oxidoreductase n=1 Tax=Serratia rhizosphaerae TaxID=2597702 RepID=A0ABX6GNR5_9GAMM|nr:NAD(P)H-dependent oxidoreductase [Serratia rhizosphaerae]MEB6334360.1 NAD(P)H-dependent oxidoreductase [Serratia rhizosphaerae]QHA87845.1 NAD(P)H-dependent oxidoreductase [Serratia rhizosphaerae]